MRIVCNAVASKMGGAANYLRHVARELTRIGSGDEFIFLVPPRQAAAVPAGDAVRVLPCDVADGSAFRRLWFDQVGVRRILRRERADVLFSVANFAMFNCPCPQLLLVRQPLYFTREYLTHILPRQRRSIRWGTHLRRWLAYRSIEAADIVMTPSQAMLDDVRRYVRVPAAKARVNHYGVDVSRFRARAGDRAAAGPVRLLFPSLYAEHKNFRTLLLALVELSKAGVDWTLTTPADPNRDDARWTCTWREDARLAAQSPLRERIHFLPHLDAANMPELYAAADAVVYPSAIESFGHPLLESLAAGLPVVAADAPINRELAGDAALYFRWDDPQDFARQLQRVIADAGLRSAVRERCAQQVARFTWSAHVGRMLQAIRSLANAPAGVQDQSAAGEALLSGTR